MVTHATRSEPSRQSKYLSASLFRFNGDSPFGIWMKCTKNFRWNSTHIVSFLYLIANFLNNILNKHFSSSNDSFVICLVLVSHLFVFIHIWIYLIVLGLFLFLFIMFCSRLFLSLLLFFLSMCQCINSNFHQRKFEDQKTKRDWKLCSGILIIDQTHGEGKTLSFIGARVRLVHHRLVLLWRTRLSSACKQDRRHARQPFL